MKPLLLPSRVDSEIGRSGQILQGAILAGSTDEDEVP